MRVAYFDCFAGISGNMVIGSLLDAGLEMKDLQEALGKLPIGGYRLVDEILDKKGIKGRYFNVELLEEQPHRHLQDILEIIEASSLEEEVKNLAKDIFRILAEAEAKVHNTSIEEIHFHEVGAVDAIIDIVGTSYGLHKLKIDKVYASSLHLGQGMVECAHGLMPIPAPATAEILKGVKTYTKGIEGELVTPTGAAIIKTIAEKFGSQPSLQVENIAYGAGSYDLEIPNLLRLMIGQIEETEIEDEVYILETNIDDMNPEVYDYVFQQLLYYEALDVYLTPIQMKKNRPGNLLTVICKKEDLQNMMEIVLLETTTLGLRYFPIKRYKIDRRIETLETKWGKVHYKISLDHRGKIVKVKPEYEDCRKIAQTTGIPLRKVQEKCSQEYIKKNNL